MSLEAWGDENPDDAYAESWMDAAIDAGWIDPADHSPGALAILNERERQEAKEGWTPEHDDNHPAGELARAGACYALVAAGLPSEPIRHRFWPFRDWWKPKSIRTNLVRAGALIAAEIDRLDRAEKPTT